MKKRILLLTAIAGMSALVLTSGKNGAGAESGYNATGSETGLGNINGCKASGCHGTTPTTGITVNIELDSAGIPRHYYTPGITYSVKITGTNTTSSTLPRFGFQLSCIKGTTAVVTPVNAGVFQSTGLPAGVRITLPTVNFVCSLMEHSGPIPATTLGGATGGTYVVAFNWTAPVAGTGTVSFWAALNAVNFDNAVTGDSWNTTKLDVTEGAQSVAGTPQLSKPLSVTAFPNPVSANLNIHVDNATPGSYSLEVFAFSGRKVHTESTFIDGSQTARINTSGWMPGLYQLVLEKDDLRQIIPIVKQ